MVESNTLLGWCVSQHVEHNRSAAQMPHPMLADKAEDHGRLDLARTDLGAADGRDSPWIRPAAAMKHRQRPQIDTVVAEADIQRIAQRRHIDAAVAVDDSLRIAGGAGGI